MSLALVVLATLAAQSSAPARIAVLPSVVGAGDVTPRQIFEAAATATEWRLALAPLSYEALFLEGSAPIARRLRECGAQADCLARAMQSNRIDLLLNVIVSFAIEPPLVTLSLIDQASGEARRTDVFEPKEEPLDAALARRAQRLLDDAGFERAGDAAVVVRPAGADVTLDGANVVERTAARTLFRAAPGTYPLRVALDGYLDVQRSIAITGGERADVDVLLQQVPVESAGLLERPWFWVAAGAVVAGAVTTAVVLSNRDPAARCLCIATVDAPCGVCGE